MDFLGSSEKKYQSLQSFYFFNFFSNSKKGVFYIYSPLCLKLIGFQSIFIKLFFRGKKGFVTIPNPACIQFANVRMLVCFLYRIIIRCVLFIYTGRPRGVGFVRYDRRCEAEKAIEGLNGNIPHGGKDPLIVKFANNPGQHYQKCLQQMYQQMPIISPTLSPRRVGGPVSAGGSQNFIGPMRHMAHCFR